MHCALYDAGRCHSCQWPERPVPQQLADKMADLRTLLTAISVAAWGEPISGPETAFHNKARMVVSGSVERPLLGTLHHDGIPVDFTDCPLYPSSFVPVSAVLKSFIARAGLAPYNVARKHGELKYLLLTASQQGEMILRFVLRSEAKLIQLRVALSWLQTQFPQLKVITTNIQSVHMAIMEGEQGTFFIGQQALGEAPSEVLLQIRPQSLFQTNPAAASRLYVTVRDWVCALSVQHMWDLFYGVGGFGLHCTIPAMRLTGIGIVPEVIICARQSAVQLGLSNLRFQALDSTQLTTHEGDILQLMSINPSRRGIGAELCDYLSRMVSPYTIYSSCSARTMAADIARLRGCRVKRVQLFDIFPHTAHYEVSILLVREV